MKITVKEEWCGGDRIQRVKDKEEFKLWITTQMFPNKESFDKELAASIDVTDKNYKLEFQDCKRTMARLITEKVIYEYYSLSLDNNYYLLYNRGLLTLRVKVNES